MSLLWKKRKMAAAKTRVSTSTNILEVDKDDRITLNVSGFRYTTYLMTLKNVPDTRLSWLAENHPKFPEFDQELQEYFFDRHPRIFAEVLSYYRTGKLHCPVDMCSALFQEELSYWGISDKDIESCCWVHYKRQINTEKTLKSFRLDSARKNDDEDQEKANGRQTSVLEYIDVDAVDNSVFKFFRYCKNIRPTIWAILDEPHSSKWAKMFVLLSSVFIILSLTQFTLGTVESIRKNPNAIKVLRVLDITASVWFTLEFVLRFIFCPGRGHFLRNPMNWIDFLAVVPFYLSFFNIRKWTTWLVVMKSLRIFRVLHLSFSFQVLLWTLGSCKNELLLFFVSSTIPIVFFSSLIYFAEKEDNKEMFPNIPESFWWTVVTVTTLGYGDVYPVTKLGKVIGGLCAMSGVIILALPVSVIGNSFSYYYTQARTRVQQPRRAPKAHALTHIPTSSVFIGQLSRRRGGGAMTPVINATKSNKKGSLKKRIRGKNSFSEKIPHGGTVELDNFFVSKTSGL